MAPSFDVIVISGASRGFGAACAQCLASVYSSATYHLLASSAGNLEETCVAVNKKLSKGFQAFPHGIDLMQLSNGNAAGCKSLISSLQACSDKRVLFLHSAAVLGPYTPLEKVDLAEIASVTQINVGGSIALANILVSNLPASADLTCVNVSSKCAIVPGMMPELDLYSITKSAIEFLFRTLAQKGHRVLNFAPGPMKTDMTVHYSHINEIPWVTPDDAASAMLTLLQSNTFASGDHIDYLDDILASVPAVAAHPPAPIAEHMSLITRIECFSSSHTMTNCSWDDRKNKDVFGKCSNLHGHNYKAEFSFVGSINPDTGMVANITDLKAIIQELLGKLDHSHLNDHTEIFGPLVTTAENIARVLFEHVDSRLKQDAASVTVHKVKLWETDKNIAEYPFRV